MAAALEIEIDFTTQQFELLDRLAAKWGVPREAVVERILDEAVDSGDSAPSRDAE